MKVLAIVGSPRKGGNTDTLIDRFIEGARSQNAEVEKIYLRDLDINCCQGGFTCEVAGRCVIPDDMGQLATKIRAANGVILGTPVYMGNVPGLVVNLLVRCRQFISYIDALGSSDLSPEEEKALAEEKTCLSLWNGTHPYAEAESFAEQLMDRRIRSYYDKYGSHPACAKRLEKGKRGAIILCFGQDVENRYPDIVNFLETNLSEFWGTDLLDTLSVHGVVKKGDAQNKEDLLELAFNTGQKMCMIKNLL